MFEYLLRLLTGGLMVVTLFGLYGLIIGAGWILCEVWRGGR